MTAPAGVIPRSPFQWAGVTDADKPVIGWGIIPSLPGLAYLADPAAVRPPDERESAAYAERYDYPEWASWPKLAAGGMAFAARPVPALVPDTPEMAAYQACSNGLHYAAQIEDPYGPDGLAGLDAGAEAAFARFSAATDAQDAAERGPDGTAPIPVTSALTETFPAATEEDL
jgi:hypothetical protein